MANNCLEFRQHRGTTQPSALGMVACPSCGVFHDAREQHKCAEVMEIDAYVPELEHVDAA